MLQVAATGTKLEEEDNSKTKKNMYFAAGQDRYPGPSEISSSQGGD
jgi:hypothetical protein